MHWNHDTETGPDAAGSELHEVVRELASTRDLPAVLRRVTELARSAAAADTGYVERIDPERAEVEIVATAGPAAPLPGARFPYPGSLAEEAVHLGRPEVATPDAMLRRPTSAALMAICPQCTALVVPLLSEEEALGTLVLLRSPGRPAFRDEDIDRLRVFADLAALALRHARMLEEAEQRRTELELVMESRSHLIRGFGHDVKNPLGAADGYLALLEDGILGKLAPRQLDSIGRVRRSIGSALNLINELVEVARAQSGQIELDPGPLEVREAVMELVEGFRARAEARRLILEAEAGEELPVLVTDGRRVRQILGRLISNAIKFTPEGGSVRVSARLASLPDGASGAWVSISVRDTGPGVPDGKQEEIFRELTGGIRGATAGEGLRLAIGRRVARALGGDLHVESRDGEGARFTLWLPPSHAPG